MPNKDQCKNRAYMKEYMLKRYHMRRSKAIDKLGGKCKCGETDNLQFDHVDPNTKSFAIGSLSSVSEEKFWKEIQKCQLLCIKCHEAKTLLESGKKSAKGVHGTLSSFRYCKCVECKKAKADYMREYKKNRKKNVGR